MDYKILADLLLPEVRNTVEYYENLYSKRNLPEGAMVTRFAPSPTGFLHMGAIFASLIYERLAHQSGGVFYLRIEDTDRKREVKGSTQEIIRALKVYGISFDEGMINDTDYIGNYGPYKQSMREDIYKTYVKHLVVRGLAYPCFCTTEELNEIRKVQMEQKASLGYCGTWAKCRNITMDEIKRNLEEGKKFVIRLKSPGDPEKRIIYNDLIRGRIEMPENNQDIVILKGDGLPTYHFAHAVDDHLMRTTHVTRAEEWLPSTAIHLQLFEVLGFEVPRYAHISQLMKMDGNSKRKLSKRKDPEISFSYYDKLGYPVESVIEYLLSIINSSFEDWRRENPGESYTDFKVEIERMSSSGCLFDLNKLMDTSKNVISKMEAGEVCSLYLEWARTYDMDMANLVETHMEYIKRFLSIERGTEKPRKDIARWCDVRDYSGYIFDELFHEGVKSGYIWPANLNAEDIRSIIQGYIGLYNHGDDKDSWFERIRNLSESLGFARDMKSYKKNPGNFRGHIGDVSMIIRIALTNKTTTPDLYEIMQVMGDKRVMERLNRAANLSTGLL